MEGLFKRLGRSSVNSVLDQNMLHVTCYGLLLFWKPGRFCNKLHLISIQWTGCPICSPPPVETWLSCLLDLLEQQGPRRRCWCIRLYGSMILGKQKHNNPCVHCWSRWPSQWVEKTKSSEFKILRFWEKVWASCFGTHHLPSNNSPSILAASPCQ